MDDGYARVNVYVKGRKRHYLFVRARDLFLYFFC